MHRNGTPILEGDIEAVKLYAEALVYGLNGTVKKEPIVESACQITVYTIPIMSNPSHLQSVQLRVELDTRTNRGHIGLDRGSELLEWQSRVKSLCYDCRHHRTVAGRLICTEMMAPEYRKQSCRKYSHKS